MRRNILVCTAIVVLMLFACKKSHQSGTASSPENISKPSASLTTSGTFHQQLFTGKGVAKKEIVQSGQLPGNERHLLPMEQTAISRLHSYYLTETSADGTVTSCRILSREPIPSSVNLFDFPTGKKSLLFYNGSTKQNRVAKIVLKINGTKTDLSTVIDKSPASFASKNLPCEQQPPVCIDWYWTTYDVETGEIISEEYVGTTCTIPCVDGGGGGGGGGGPVVPDEPSCQQQLDDFADGGTPLSTKISVEICGSGPNTRTKCYTWKIYTVSGGMIPMYLISKERGVQSNLGQNIWQFDSFEHTEVSKSGTQILYSASATNVVSTSTLKKSGSITYNDIAQMHLSFTVEFSIICDGLPVVKTNSTSTINAWHVSQ